MGLTNTLKKVVDRKQWEFCTPCPSTNAAGTCVVSSTFEDPHGLKLYMVAASTHYLYFPKEDAWLSLPGGVFGGTMGAGACGAYVAAGPTGTASAGSTTTLTSTLTIPGSLVGYKIRITAGTGRGQEATILSNTVGANAVFTFAALGTALDATSVYELRTGRFFIWNAGTMSATSFQYYDVATNTWTARSVTGGPATMGTDGILVATQGGDFATGTATSATGTTLVNSAKTWTASQWINYQVRITGGTGAGQVRVITANTGTTLTVATWTVTPDATSTYVIEGDENALYLLGNNSVTLYKYTISGNSWSALSPGVARSSAPGAGTSGIWVYAQPEDAWTSESVILNGRRIYSWRGGASSSVDYYDIPSNAWTNALEYLRRGDTFTTGSSWAYSREGYIYAQKDATGRFFRFSPSLNTIDPWSTILYAQSTAVVGDKTFVTEYTEGDTTLYWVYSLRNSGTELFRCLVV